MTNQLTSTDTSPNLTPQEQKLINTIRAELDSGMERARLLMEKEKRQTYWNVGMHIKEHLLKNSSRADYGESLFELLAKNLEITQSELYRSVKCYEEYPKILEAPPKLTWTHIVNLLPIEDKKLRHSYEKKIVEENLSTRDLKTLIKKDKGISESQKEKPALRLERGEPWTYRLKTIEGQQMVDLGFRMYRQKEDNYDKKYKFTNTDTGSVPYYTYMAYLVEVIDGDTLWVNIDLGFGNWTKQKLRFRGINTREIESAEGQTAKQYIEKQLNGCKFLAIKTYWRDKFTRYLADVFYDKNESDFTNLVINGKFLNQELLDNGLAVKY